jgi:FAD/FMN-containing dehydrogenase
MWFTFMETPGDSISVRIKRILGKILRFLGYLLAGYAVVITLVVWIAGDGDFAGQLHENVVNDITELNPVPMASVVTPHSIEEIVAAIQGSSGPISIGGGRFSMGGQTAIDNGLQLDMREFDDVVAFDASQQQITVQSGISWRELQEYVDPHDLSVKIMQTYANFSVGGSLSVNVHGRYIGHGPIISSVRAIQLVLADGTVMGHCRGHTGPGGQRQSGTPDHDNACLGIWRTLREQYSG